MTSTSDNLRDPVKVYFYNFAIEAFERTKASFHLLQQYELLKRQLDEGLDLGAQFPQAQQLGPEITKAVVSEAIQALHMKMDHAWDLPAFLLTKGRWSVHRSVHQFEHLPRTHATYRFHGSAANLDVEITTAGERLDVTIVSGRNSLATEQARGQLEKYLTFAALGTQP